jgi:hypothetical protein
MNALDVMYCNDVLTLVFSIYILQGYCSCSRKNNFLRIVRTFSPAYLYTHGSLVASRVGTVQDTYPVATQN